MTQKIPFYEITSRLDADRPEAEHLIPVPDHAVSLHVRIRVSDGSRLVFQWHDPIRNRGCFIPWYRERWGDEFELTFSRDKATVGLLKGPIVAGDWRLSVSAYPLDESTSYVMQFSYVPAEEDRDRWYAGDLHTHTNHSDGVYSGEETVRLAMDNGLQFMFITDHNTTSFFNELDDEAKAELAKREFLVLPGVELTTTCGHANALGVWEPVDWRVGNGRTFQDAASDTKAQGALFSINHPFSPNPRNTWREWDMDPARIDCLEIWNGHLALSAGEGVAIEAAMAKWDELLNDGHRITGVGGSDALHPRPEGQRIGLPKTYVRAERLTREDIVKGLKEGRVVVSAGPLPQVQAEIGERAYQVGDRISVVGEKFVNVRVNCPEAKPYIVQLVRNGEVVDESGLQGCSAIFTAAGLRVGDWLRVQIRDAERHWVAVANPFYFVQD